MTKDRICTRCGDSYTPETARQQICSKEHFKSCKNCGNDYPWGKRGVTCSSLCATALRKQSGSKFECVWCKEEFTSNNPRAMYCARDHYSDCEQCGVSFVVASVHRPSKTCSSSCASALTHTEEADAKRKATSIERFGTEHPFQNDGIKAKIQASLDSSEKDMRFGSKKFQKAISEKYGVINASQISEVKSKKAATSLRNYGVDNPMKSPEVRNTFRKNMVQIYGVTSPAHIHIENYSDFIEIEKWLSSQDKKPSIHEVAKHFNVGPSTIRKIKEIKDLHRLFSPPEPREKSLKERAFADFLFEKFPEVPFVRNARSLIGRKELDFYFPDHKFAVEISPTSTHATDSLAFGGNSQKNKEYHVDKALACEAAGIELLTIFDWMPWEKTLSMIEHKLKGSQRVFARKCSTGYIAKDLSNLSKEIKRFVNDSHVLGFNGRGTSHYTYLKFEEEIVGVAAWGEPRNLSVNSKSKNKLSGSIELIRMCFKPGFAVTGGASRLLKEFVRNYENPLTEIVTFSDYDLGWGNIYKTLGFDLLQAPKPQLNYSHPLLTMGSDDDARGFRVKNTSLHMAGADRLLKNVPGYTPAGMVCVCSDIKHSDNSCLPSNVEIVQSYGFLSVWDCGYKKWALTVNRDNS